MSISGNKVLNNFESYNFGNFPKVKIHISGLVCTQIVMAVVPFLWLRHFFGTVFLSILEMLDHLTFLKDGLKLLFSYALFRFM